MGKSGHRARCCSKLTVRQVSMVGQPSKVRSAVFRAERKKDLPSISSKPSSNSSTSPFCSQRCHWAVLGAWGRSLYRSVRYWGKRCCGSASFVAQASHSRSRTRTGRSGRPDTCRVPFAACHPRYCTSVVFPLPGGPSTTKPGTAVFTVRSGVAGAPSLIISGESET